MSESQPKLATLEVAIAPYAGLTLKQVRAWIRAGKLPWSKVGKFYFIDPLDLARLLAPKLEVRPTRPRPEAPTKRADRQLAAAGIR